jgi:hypothetical protein
MLLNTDGPVRPIAVPRERATIRLMGQFDELRTHISGLSRDALQGDASPELLAEMEHVLSDGYINALMAEAEVRTLRADLAVMRGHLMRLRAVRSA